MKKILLLPFLLYSLIACAQTDTTIVKFINPASLSMPKGYSHCAIIDLGSCKMLMISGQVALDKEGNLVGKEDFAKQTEKVFSNIKSIVEDTGGLMDNLVKINIYVTDISKIQLFRDIRNKFISAKNPPASTLVQVSKLVRDDLLLEVEATAIIAKK